MAPNHGKTILFTNDMRSKKKLKLSYVFLLLLCNFSHLPLKGQDSLKITSSFIGLDFDSAELSKMKAAVAAHLLKVNALHRQDISNNVPLGLIWIPPVNNSRISNEPSTIDWALPTNVSLPKDMGKLAFYSVSELAYLIKNRQITSLELTQLFLSRLKKYSDTLQCTITLTDSLALSQAQRADIEIKQGIYRGPLHGIPYGAKDLLNVAGYKTTWGATPFKSQVFSKNAEIINRLEAAGAVLVAKLTLGALAWGDVWYGGKTRNPWDLEQGSSGSSAGSASATVAGLVPFAIGSETLGSIVSPSTRCGATGLRPTFGRISNDGAMALSWTMDKLGPICRNALDCALVFEVIRGTDGKDLSVRDAPFNYHYNNEIKNLRIGVLTDDQNPNFYSENDQNTLLLLKSKGYDLVEKTLPENIPIEALSFILEAEAAAAFNFLTQSNQDDLMVRQTDNAWPNIFRAAQLIPAVAYIQANRLRYELTLQFNELMSDIDILMVPSFSNQLLITNLTGHPCVVIPNGSYADENPGSITLLGNHFDEASILSLARFLQEITPYNKEHPDLFKP